MPPGPFLPHVAGPDTLTQTIYSKSAEEAAFLYSNSKIKMILVPLWYTKHISSYAEHMRPSKNIPPGNLIE